MDMKQILAAFDGAGKKPVTGTNDMKRFVSIIKENSQLTKPEGVAEMDSQGYRGHRGDEDPGKGPEKSVKPAKIKDVAKDAEKDLTKAMDREHAKKKQQGVAEGAEEDLAAIEQHPEADDPRIQRAIADKKKELSTKEEGVHNGLTFKDYFALEESKKKITASEDPCWKGYKMVGTKKKGGKEVPNCVPGKKGD
jgi:hypothetical protein